MWYEMVLILSIYIKNGDELKIESSHQPVLLIAFNPIFIIFAHKLNSNFSKNQQYEVIYFNIWMTF